MARPSTIAKPSTITLCADDYGLSYGVSAGILEALDAQRLSAVSALTNGPRWPAMGRELLRRAYDVDIGLHFNLTLGHPLSAMPKLAASGEFPRISTVIRAALSRNPPMDEIRAEIDRQLDRFEAVLERPPDFVDGHQHVHVLPAYARRCSTRSKNADWPAGHGCEIAEIGHTASSRGAPTRARRSSCASSPPASTARRPGAVLPSTTASPAFPISIRAAITARSFPPICARADRAISSCATPAMSTTIYAGSIP